MISYRIFLNDLSNSIDDDQNDFNVEHQSNERRFNWIVHNIFVKFIDFFDFSSLKQLQWWTFLYSFPLLLIPSSYSRNILIEWDKNKKRKSSISLKLNLWKHSFVSQILCFFFIWFYFNNFPFPFSRSKLSTFILNRQITININSKTKLSKSTNIMSSSVHT